MKNEDEFQVWVQARINAMPGHYEDHRYSRLPNVPDLSAGVFGRDYWLELKYQQFKLLHSRYDDFEFDTLTRGQLDWLKWRQFRGGSICGVLAYIHTVGDHPGVGVPYLFFMTADRYLKKLWRKKVNAGGVIIGWSCCAAAHSIKTGADLFAFIDRAARDGSDNGA